MRGCTLFRHRQSHPALVCSARAYGRSGGFSLIEQALVLPVLLLLILGALDINDALQSYTALKEGTRAALRCQYTVDGRCVSASVQPPSRLFNWYDLQCTSHHVFNSVDHSATVSRLEYPTYTYSMSARILDQVHFSIPRVRYFQRQPFWAAQGDVAFALLAAEGPYLAGSNPREPQIVFPQPQSHNRQYPRQPAVSVFSDRIASPHNRRIVVAEFEVPPPPASDNSGCFSARPFNHDPDGPEAPLQPNFSQPCPQREIAHSTRIAIHVKGIRNVSSGSSGHLLLRTRRQLPDGSWEDPVERGGQSLSQGTGEANFYPRGVPVARMDPQIRYQEDTSPPQIRDEWRLPEATQIEVQYNQRYRVIVYMDSENGSGTINWRSTGVDVYTPQWVPVQTLSFPCDQPLPADMQGCSMNALQVPPTLPIFNVRQSVPEQKSYPQAAVALGDCQDRFNNGIPQPPPLPEPGFEITQSDCSTQGSGPCPAIAESLPGGNPNYGVSDPVDAQGRITSSQAAEAICPASSLHSGATQPYWTEADQPLPDSLRTLIWAREDCLTGFSMPAAYQIYPKLLAPVLVSSVFAPLNFSYSPEHSPQRLKEQDARFNCDEIRLYQYQLDDSLPPQLEHDCLFRGNHDDLGSCSEDRLAADAAQFHGADSHNWIETHSRAVARITQPQPPADICTPFHVNYHPEGRTLITPEPLPEGLTPPGCQSPGRTCPCDAVFAGLSSPHSPGPQFDQAAAAQQGYEAVQAAMPRSRTDCSGN